MRVVIDSDHAGFEQKQRLKEHLAGKGYEVIDVGTANAANKVRGVRAANVTSPEFAVLAREHNDANIVTVSARSVPVQVTEEIVGAFLATEFAGGRHGMRVDEILHVQLEKRGSQRHSR